MQEFSTLEFQRQMSFTRNKTVFDLYHEIRLVMGKRDYEYRLEDMVEYEEAYVNKQHPQSRRTPRE